MLSRWVRLVVFGLWAGAVGCGDCAPGSDCGEPGGGAEYSVHNLSSVQVWVTAESLGASFASTLPMAVPPGMSRRLGSDGIIGGDPEPSVSFAWVALSVVTSTQGILQEVDRQEPVVREAWVGGRVDESEQGYGLSAFVLEVEDADLAL